MLVQQPTQAAASCNLKPFTRWKYKYGYLVCSVLFIKELDANHVLVFQDCSDLSRPILNKKGFPYYSVEAFVLLKSALFEHEAEARHHVPQEPLPYSDYLRLKFIHDVKDEPVYHESDTPIRESYFSGYESRDLVTWVNSWNYYCYELA